MLLVRQYRWASAKFILEYFSIDELQPSSRTRSSRYAYVISVQLYKTHVTSTSVSMSFSQVQGRVPRASAKFKDAFLEVHLRHKCTYFSIDELQPSSRTRSSRYAYVISVQLYKTNVTSTSVSMGFSQVQGRVPRVLQYRWASAKFKDAFLEVRLRHKCTYFSIDGLQPSSRTRSSRNAYVISVQLYKTNVTSTSVSMGFSQVQGRVPRGTPTIDGLQPSSRTRSSRYAYVISVQLYKTHVTSTSVSMSFSLVQGRVAPGTPTSQL
ncbi:hypothetical protein J6590_034399 [Homalodisca vitripennis]|nr:hypothetical protein J6590_034399 [Homalodisca vitripennis]